MNTLNIRGIHWCVFALLFVVLEGCSGQPLPADKKSYAGKWVNSSISLQISLDGQVSYKKEEGNTKTTINGPIKEFEKDNFVVGVWILTTTFEVQRPPFKEGERWAMIVDGNKLYKVIGSAGSTEVSLSLFFQSIS